MKLEVILIWLFLFFQVAFWNGFNFLGFSWIGTLNQKPNLKVIPPIESEQVGRLLSFGDSYFYHRYKSFVLQNAGDEYGRVTPLKNYDYSLLYKWFTHLDKFNWQSNYLPSLASYYFSGSQEPKRDLPFIISYLRAHSEKDLLKKWWWQGQAFSFAKHRLKDSKLALEIAKPLSQLPEREDIPMWVYQLSAFALEDLGEDQQACQTILSIIQNFKKLSKEEINYIYYFLEERMRVIEKDYDRGKPLDEVCNVLIQAKKSGTK
jgi:hypothetical protein